MAQRLLVGIRLQNQAMDRLHAPPAPDEFPGQPVDKLGMAGPASVLPQIAGLGHQPRAEVVLPDAIDHHPGGKGVVGTGDPFGQHLAPVGQSLQVHRIGVSGHRAEEARLDFLSPQEVVAAFQHVSAHRVPQGGVGSREGHGLEIARIVGVGETGGLLAQQLVKVLLLLAEEHSLLHGPSQIGVADVQGPVLEILGHDRPAVGLHAGLELGVLSFSQGLSGFQDGVPGGSLLFPDLGPAAGQFELGKGDGRGLEQQRGEEGLQPVVVSGGNGVVLVVVAAGATQGHAQEDRTGGADHVVEDIPAPLRTSVPLHRNPLVEEPGSQLGLVPVVAIGFAGDLFLDESIVGAILVESPDHVVAVSPQMGAGIVGRLSPGVGVANQVQPVPAPADAVIVTGKQPLDLPAIGLGGRILEKAFGFLRSGRQSDQAEIEAPQASPVGGGRRRDHSLLFQPGQDEGIHPVLDPGAVAHLGHRRFGQGRPGPGERPLPAPSIGSRRQFVNPLGDGCDVGFRQRIAGERHPRLLFPLEVLD